MVCDDSTFWKSGLTGQELGTLESLGCSLITAVPARRLLLWASFLLALEKHKTPHVTQPRHPSFEFSGSRNATELGALTDKTSEAQELWVC